MVSSVSRLFLNTGCLESKPALMVGTVCQINLNIGSFEIIRLIAASIRQVNRNIGSLETIGPIVVPISRLSLTIGYALK